MFQDEEANDPKNRLKVQHCAFELRLHSGEVGLVPTHKFGKENESSNTMTANNTSHIRYNSFYFQK